MHVWKREKKKNRSTQGHITLGQEFDIQTLRIKKKRLELSVKLQALSR